MYMRVLWPNLYVPNGCVGDPSIRMLTNVIYKEFGMWPHINSVTTNIYNKEILVIKGMCKSQIFRKGEDFTHKNKVPNKCGCKHCTHKRNPPKRHVYHMERVGKKDYLIKRVWIYRIRIENKREIYKRKNSI